jgi:hypothetical protein
VVTEELGNLLDHNWSVSCRNAFSLWASLIVVQPPRTCCPGFESRCPPSRVAAPATRAR